MEIIEMGPNGSTIKDFAYWIGVAQTDGHLQILKAKDSVVKSSSIVLGVAKKSLPMLNKFIIISRNVFGVKGCFYTRLSHIGTSVYLYRFGCKNFLNNFETLQLDFKQVNPPDWILEHNDIYGAYLAGVIDGDGDTRIFNGKYPRCYIRVYSGHIIDKFIDSIKKFLKCGVYVEKRVRIRKIGDHSFLSHCFTIEFQLSSKNIDFIKNYVVDNIAIDYKRKVIENYIKYKEMKSESVY